MKKFLTTYFEFSNRELNGFLVLVFLVIAVAFVPGIYEYFNSDETVSAEEEITFKKLSISNIPLSSEARFNNTNRYLHERTPAVMFKFDPNTIDAPGWQKLGLSPRQAASIINYRAKGGKFFRPEDLKKMYTISPELYARMLPYVAIAAGRSPSAPKVFTNDAVYKKPPLNVVDINLADSAGLDAINGIGPAFARRIIAYRARLGGFYNINQLTEVYGLDSLKYAVIKSQVKIGQPALKQFNINTATFDDLKTHPYLRYQQVNAVIQYRKQHGNFSGLADLRKVAALNEELIQKIAPYLTF